MMELVMTCIFFLSDIDFFLNSVNGKVKLVYIDIIFMVH